MTKVYEDLLTILRYAEDQIDVSNGEILEGITLDNVQYIKSVVECARNGVATAGA